MILPFLKWLCNTTWLSYFQITISILTLILFFHPVNTFKFINTIIDFLWLFSKYFGFYARTHQSVWSIKCSEIKKKNSSWVLAREREREEEIVKDLEATRNGGKISNSKYSVRLHFKAFSSSVPARYLSDWKKKGCLNLWVQGYKEVPNLCLFH